MKERIEQERAAFGVDHRELGATMLSEWEPLLPRAVDDAHPALAEDLLDLVVREQGLQLGRRRRRRRGLDARDDHGRVLVEPALGGYIFMLHKLIPKRQVLSK